MTPIETEKLCLSLINCNDGREVLNLLKEYNFWDKEELWRPYGDIEGKWSTINAHGATDYCLNEKITNSIDAVLANKCWEQGINPEDKEKTEALIKNLEVDETLGQLLVSEGFQSIEEISQAKAEDISKIEAIDEDTAKELITRSKDSLVKVKEEVGKRLKELGVEDELINLKGMTQGMLVILGQKNIKKISDFADLSSDELIGGYDEIKGKKIRIDGYLEEFSLSRKEADELIMAAREIAYK